MSRFYGFDKYDPGDSVRIANHEVLTEFARTWKYHHPLQPEQLSYAGQIAKVAESFMYHGGDIIYRLEGVPGMWHQHLLSESAS